MSKVGYTTATLSFQKGTTQSITNNLALIGAAGNLLSLRSTEDDADEDAADQWFLDVSAPAFQLSYLDVKDSYVLTLPALNAAYSNNSGNNVGWSFAPFYWVGGAGGGNWSDASKWATSSGGQGGGGVPTANDTVIFDSLSGAGVSIADSGFSPASIANIILDTGFPGTARLGKALTVSGNVVLKAGTLDMSSSNYALAVTGDWLNDGGTFNGRAGTVTLNSIVSGRVLRPGASAFYNLTLNGPSGGTNDTNGGYWTLGSNMTVNNNLTVTYGSLDVSDNNYGITIAGNWTFSNKSKFYARQGTVTWTGAVAAPTLNRGAWGSTSDNLFYNLVVNKSAGSLTLAGYALYVTNDLTISSGGLDVSASNYGIAVYGSWLNAGTFTARSGSVALGASGQSGTLTPGNSSFYSLNIQTGSNVTLGGNLIVTTIFYNYGTLDVSANNFSMTVPQWDGSTSGSFNARQGTVTFSATAAKTIKTYNASFYNVNFNSAGITWTLSNYPLTVANNLTITAGTLSTSGNAVNVSRNWSNSGTFTHGNGTVTLNGTNQTISGNTTFFSLNKTVSSADALIFQKSSTQTISGTLTLRGAAGALLSLRSSENDGDNDVADQWTINPSGTRTISYVDVKDSNNSNATAITVYQSTDSGTNTNWSISDTPTYYWVGGTASWCNSSSWATSSGGPGGAGAPTSGTDVVFDGNSGSSSMQTNCWLTARNVTITADYPGQISLSVGMTVSGNFTMNGGSLAQNNRNIELSGNWSRSGGAFTVSTGAVLLLGGDQSISGSNTFYNLTKTVTSAKTLTFQKGSTQTVMGTLTLTGSAGALLSVRSSEDDDDNSADDQWNVDPTHTNVQYVDLKDSNNISEITRPAVNSTDAGTNTDWDFSGTYYWVGSPSGGNWSNSYNWASTSGGPGGAGVPDTSTESAYFDGNSGAGSVSMNSTATTIKDLTADEGFGGTISLGANLTVSGDFAMSGGSFSVNAKTLTVAGGWSNSATLNSYTGSVVFSATSTKSVSPGASAFNNLTLSGSGGVWQVMAGQNLTVNNTLTLTNGTLDISTNTATLTSNGTLSIAGGTLDATGGTIDATDVSITSGTLIAPDGERFTVAEDWTYSGGTFTPSTGTVTFDSASASVLTGFTTFNHFKCTTAGKTITFEPSTTHANIIAGTWTINGVQDNNIVLNRWTSGTGRWRIDPQGERNISYVTVSNSNNINATVMTHSNASNGGNNVNWGFAGFNITGTVYTSDEVTPIASAAVAMRIDGTGLATTTTDAVGAFNFNNVSAVAGQTLTFYLTGATKGNTVAITDGTTNITDIAIMGAHVIVRNDSAAAAIAIPDLVDYDRASPNGNDTTNMLFDAVSGSPNTLTLSAVAGTELWIQAGDIFVPGGNVTTGTGGIDLNGTWNGGDGSGTITMNGNFDAVGGTLTNPPTNQIFSVACTITGNLTFNNLEFTAAAARTYTLLGANVIANGTLTLSGAGALTLNTGNLYARGAAINYTNTAANAASGGTAKLIIDGTGDQTLTSNITITQGGLPQVWINKTAGDLTLTGNIVSNNSWTFTRVGGTFSVANTTIAFQALSGTSTITGSQTLNDVQFNGFTSARTFTFASGTVLTVPGTLTIGGNNGVTINTNDSDGIEINAKGNITVTNTFAGGGGTATINIVAGAGEGASSDGNQTLTSSGAAGQGRLPKIEVNKTAGTLTLCASANCTISSGQNWTYTAGTVDAITNNSTVGFYVSSTLDGQGAAATMSFGNIIVGVASITLGGNLDVEGNVTINAASTLSTGGSTFNINVGGNWTNAGTFTSGAGVYNADPALTKSTVFFDNPSAGANTATINTGGTTDVFDFQHFTVNKPGGTLQLITNHLGVNGTLTVTDGIFDLNGKNVIDGSGAGAPTRGNIAGTIKLTGNETLFWAANDIDSGTYSYAGDNTAGNLTIKDFGATDYYNLVINDINATKRTFIAGGALTIAGTLNVTSATYNANGQITTVTGLATVNGGTCTAGVAQQNFNGGLTISSGSYTGGAGNTDVNGNFTLSDTGTMTAPNGDRFTVSGDWIHTGTSVFDHNTGTVRFDGTNQAISGTNTFNHLMKIEPTNDSTDVTLTFDNAATQTILGTLTLDGLDTDDRINLRSNVPGAQWLLAAMGAFAIDYVDAQDSDARSGLFVQHTNAIDSGNNLNWGWVTLRGIFYLQDGTTPATSGNGGICDGNAENISLRVNGGSVTTASCSATDGSFTVLGVKANAGDRLTVYSTGSAKANTVTITDGISPLTNLHLIQNAVILRSDNGANPVAIPNLIDYDNDQDAVNMLYNADNGIPKILTVENGVKLLINAGSTFSPNGNVIVGTGGLEISGTFAPAGGTLRVDGSFTIKPAASFTADGLNYNIFVAGDWTNQGSFVSGTGVVNFVNPIAGPNTTKIISGGTEDSQDFNTVVINKATGTVQLDTNHLDVDGELTLTAGTLDLNGHNISSATAINNSGNIQLQGSESLSVLLTNHEGSIVTFVGDGDSAATTHILTDIATTFHHLTVNDPSETNQDTFQLGAPLVVAGDLNITAGTLDASENSFQINVGGKWLNAGAFNAQAGKVLLNAQAGQLQLAPGISAFHDLTFDDGGGAAIFILQGPLTVSGDLTITGGTLDAQLDGNFPINVAGNWVNRDVFLPRQNMVTLNGTGQSILGETTFYDLKKNVAVADTLTFEAGKLQIVLHTTDLKGTETGNISLVSSEPETQWKIDPRGTRVVSWISITDSLNVNPAPVITYGQHAIDGGRNMNWKFGVEIVLQGTVYSDAGVTPLAGARVNLADKGAFAYGFGLGNHIVTNQNGQYEMHMFVLAGDLVTVFVEPTCTSCDPFNGNYVPPSNFKKGVLTFVTDAGSKSGMDIYLNHVIIRNEYSSVIPIIDFDRMHQGFNGGEACVPNPNNPAGGCATGTNPTFGQYMGFTPRTTNGQKKLFFGEGLKLFIWPGTVFKASEETEFPDVDMRGTLVGVEGKPMDVTGDFSLANGSTFTHNNAPVHFNGTGTHKIAPKGNVFKDVVFGGGGTYQFDDSSEMTVEGDFAVTSGTFVADDDQNLIVKGDMTIANGASFTPSTGDGKTWVQGNVTITDSNTTKQNLGKLVIGASPETVELGSDILTESVTINETDTLVTNGYDIEITGSDGLTVAGTLDASDAGSENTIITVAGKLEIDPDATFTPGNSTIEVNDSGSVAMTLNGAELYNFTESGTGTVELQDALVVNGDFTNSSTGTFDPNGKDITVSGNWNFATGTFAHTTETVTLTGTAAAELISTGNSFYNLVIEKSGVGDADDVNVSTKNLVVNGTLTILDGELVQEENVELNAYKVVIETDGAWTHAGGSSSDEATITIGEGGLVNAGTVSLNGAGGASGGGDSDVIKIRSTVEGVQRLWSGTGTFACFDVDVKDQKSEKIIDCYSGTNSGNNTNWLFHQSLDHFVVTSTSPGTIASGNTITVRVTPYDNGGVPILATYSGEKSITFSGPTATNGKTPFARDKNGIVVNIGSSTLLDFLCGGGSCKAETDVTLYTAETVSLDASDGTYDSTGSADYDLDLVVGSLTASAIQFSTAPAPASIFAGSVFTTQPVVSILDEAGNAISSDSISRIKLTAVLASDGTTVAPGTLSSSALDEDNTITVTGGVATFSNVSYNEGGVIKLKAELVGNDLIAPVLSSEITVTSTRSEIHFVNVSGIEVSNYSIGDYVYVKVLDADRNRDPLVKDAIKVTVSNPATGDSEEINLLESDVDSGIFINTSSVPYNPFPTVQNRTGHVDNGTLEVSGGGDLVTVTYTDSNDSTDTSTDTVTFGSVSYLIELLTQGLVKAGTPFDVRISAVETGAGGNKAVVSYSGTANLGVQYINPTAGTKQFVPAVVSNFSGGIATASLQYDDAGIIQVLASDSADGVIKGVSGNLTVIPYEYKVVVDEKSFAVGKDFEMTVTAVNQSGEVTSNYDGAADVTVVTEDGGTVENLAVTNLSSISNGTVTLTNRFNAWGEVSLKVIDTQYPELLFGTSESVSFVASKFQIELSKPADASRAQADLYTYYDGEKFTATVSAFDFNNQAITNYAGKIGLSSGVELGLPEEYEFTGSDQGIHVFNIIGPGDLPEFSITAEDADAEGESSPKAEVVKATIVIESSYGALNEPVKVTIKVVDSKGQVIKTDSTRVTVQYYLPEGKPVGQTGDSLLPSLTLPKQTEFVMKNGVCTFEMKSSAVETIYVGAAVMPESAVTVSEKRGVINFGSVGSRNLRIVTWKEMPAEMKPPEKK